MYSSYPEAQYRAYKNEIDKKIIRTLNSGNYILGEQVKNFEKTFARFCDTKYAVGVNSGTDALLISLMSMSVRINSIN